MKYLVSLVLRMFSLPFGCKRGNEGFDAGRPVTRYLHGRWQLEKVVSPLGTKTGAQIGFTEIIETGNNQVEDYDKLVRDGSSVR